MGKRMRAERTEMRSLLSRHCKAKPVFGRNQVIEIDGILSEVDLHPHYFAGKLGAALSVIIRHRGACLEPDIASFVGGEDHRLCLVDTALAAFSAIHVEGDCATFCKASAIVSELHPHLMFPGRDLAGALDVVLLQAIEIVTIFWLAVLGVEAPASMQASLSDDDAFGPRIGHDHLGRHSVRLVFDVDDGAFGKAPHPAEQQLPVALD
jgi:hypothetical protein